MPLTTRTLQAADTLLCRNWQDAYSYPHRATRVCKRKFGARLSNARARYRTMRSSAATVELCGSSLSQVPGESVR